MRLSLTLLICLLLTACSNQPAAGPAPQVISQRPDALTKLHSFRLIAPEQAITGAMPLPALYPQMAQLLSSQLQMRGYKKAPTADINVYYWLSVQDHPLQFKVDLPPPNALGPYQAIHQLRDETGTLRLRLTDAQGDIVFWEGTVITGLSPASDSRELLEQALQALTELIPHAARDDLKASQ